jgi:hypothetical protein
MLALMDELAQELEKARQNDFSEVEIIIKHTQQ